LQERHKISYLFITHDLKVIEAVAHRIMVMKNGQIIETGETEQIFKNPKKDYTRKLLTASLFKNDNKEVLSAKNLQITQI